MPLSPAEIAVLRAVMDRVIPHDDWPSATEAGADAYVLRQLAGDCQTEAGALCAGLVALDAEAGGGGFAALDPTAQDAVLARIERGDVRTPWSVSPGAWFARVVELTAEGYYADPGNGGNRERVSWKMIGYNPRTPKPRVNIAGPQ